MNAAASRPTLRVWVLVLGASGFAAGFVGPVLLDPGANQGPLLGIFITGPGAALAGLILGAGARALPMSDAARARTLVLACLAVLVSTLWLCLPKPALLGYVIDGEIGACVAAVEAGDAALADWQRAVARTTWATPSANWQQTALHNLADEAGVVVTVQVLRRAPVFEHRRPWDHGRRSTGAWSAAAAPERYYARRHECEAYLAEGRRLYWPLSAAMADARPSARAWPPTDPAGFLSLQELGALPQEYQRLLQ